MYVLSAFDLCRPCGSFLVRGGLPVKSIGGLMRAVTLPAIFYRVSPLDGGSWLVIIVLSRGHQKLKMPGRSPK